MDLRVKINGRIRIVKINPGASRSEFSLDGQGIAAEIVEAQPGILSVLIDGKVFEARIWCAPDALRVAIQGTEYLAQLEDPRQWRRAGRGASGAEGRQNIIAPMPGKVVRVLVKKGEKVTPGQGLLTVEAMKMQNEIKSQREGTIEKISVQEGQPVNAGEVLLVIA